MNLKIADQTALITGSTAGIGFAIARTLATEGVRVIVNGRTAARVDPAVAALRSEVPEAKVVGLVADLATAEGATLAIAGFPDVDILVNNLGMYEPKPFEAITDADWLAIIETNFLSGVRLSRHHLPRMKTRNAGRIIFIASESAVNIPAEMMHYGVTKTMQVALARGLAESAAGTAVTVNSILAGPTRSEGVERFLEQLAKKDGITLAQVEKDFFAKMRPTSLLQRFETIDEIAAMVAFIASPLSAGTNGAALRVEGGLLRSIL